MSKDEKLTPHQPSAKQRSSGGGRGQQDRLQSHAICENKLRLWSLQSLLPVVIRNAETVGYCVYRNQTLFT